jgi:hypothetical protein
MRFIILIIICAILFAAGHTCWKMGLICLGVALTAR